MIYRNNWIILLSNHALLQAREREIPFSMIEATIRTDRVERFGKDMLKFKNYYKRGRVICVGRIMEMNRIKILTVEWG